MNDDKIENFNELSFTQRAIARWAQHARLGWVDALNIKEEFTIRDILKTMPDKNGYYTPPYS